MIPIVTQPLVNQTPTTPPKTPKKKKLTINNIIVILPQRLDSLALADIGLRHDELNVLVLDTLGVDLAFILLLLLASVLKRLGGFTLVAGSDGAAGAAGRLLCSGKLLCGGSLGLGV